MFSNAGSQGVSQEASPEMAAAPAGAGAGLADSPRGADPAGSASHRAVPPMPGSAGPTDSLAAALDRQTKTLME
eukprot:1510330-Alexandrium_andersonii.AAC.1